MTIINSVLLSGWFQLLAFGIIFFMYSSYALRQKLTRGYILGCLIGIFFIFTYVSLNPPQAFRFGGFDGELTIIQVFLPSILGVLLGVVMIGMASVFHNSWRQKSLSVATITAMLFIVMTLQAIVQADFRIMASLFILTFGIVLLFSKIILSRHYNRRNPYDAQAENDYLNQATSPQQPVSRLASVRQRIRQRITMNDVPTNYPNTPNNR